MAKGKTINPSRKTVNNDSLGFTTHAEIQERANYRYADRGRIDGFDREDWCRAEIELRGGERPR